MFHACRTFRAMAACLWLLLSSSELGIGQIALPPFQRPPRSRPPVRETHFARSLNPNSVAMTIEQISFSFASGRASDTNWGLLSISPERWRQATGLRTGYLSVFLYDDRNDPVLVVDNLMVPPPLEGEECPASLPSLPNPPLRTTPMWRRNLFDWQAKFSFLQPPQRRLGTYIDLRPDSPAEGVLQSIRVAAIYSRYPFPVGDPAFQNGLLLQPASLRVSPAVVNAEGSLRLDESDPLPPLPGDSLDLVGPPPPPIVYPPFDPSPSDLAFPIQVFQADSPNIHSAVNQCLPLAYANALQYLEERYNAQPLVWFLPHDHFFGLGQATVSGDLIVWIPVPENSLVAQIDALTRRQGTFNANLGSGTATLCQMYEGLIRYLVIFGQFAQVELRHQGRSSSYGEGSNCDNGLVDFGGLTSFREGQFPTWEWIFDQLQKGRGVTLLYGRYDGDGTRTGGHMLRVWGAARYNNRDYIYTLDDSIQGINTTGLRTQQWEVADTGSPGAPGVPDGRLNLDGTTWEVEFVSSVEAKPTFVVP